MCITLSSPEIKATVEIARTALTRTAIRFNITRDMEEASQVLGLALYKSYLRNHPLWPSSVERHGVEAMERATAYLDGVGHPIHPPKIVRHDVVNDQRRTPPEVRALWGICEQAVGETLMGLAEKSEKALTLNLSWGLHTAMYQLNPSYRGNVDEMRRIKRSNRWIAELIAFLPLASGLVG